jgi:nucleoid-associated protein YgaU
MNGTPPGGGGLAHWSYVVQPGDTLAGIAETQLGDLATWTRIQALNPLTLQNPNLLQPGTVLAMP